MANRREIVDVNERINLNVPVTLRHYSRVVSPLNPSRSKVTNLKAKGWGKILATDVEYAGNTLIQKRGRTWLVRDAPLFDSGGTKHPQVPGMTIDSPNGRDTVSRVETIGRGWNILETEA